MSDAVLKDAVQGLRVLVCVGPGGVGKTTVSASLALQAALAGREAMVCTINPARRLANSLGLSAFGNVETRIPDEVLRSAGLTPAAPLHAMMLDMKRSWDELVTKTASPEVRERIFANRFYQALSTALAGSQEYIAMEQLWVLRSQRNYALIVLDTPPTAHALDFLEAPNRVLDFLDNEAAKLLLSPAMRAGRVGIKLFNLGSSFVLKQLSRITGADTLQELGQFLGSLSSLNEGFRERARAVKSLLSESQTGFVLVTTPATERLDEVIHFHGQLVRSRMNPVAVVVNRTHPPVDEDLAVQAAALDGPLREAVERTLAERRLLAERDAEGIEKLRAALAGVPLVVVPRFASDVHDLAGLAHTGAHLMAGVA